MGLLEKEFVNFMKNGVIDLHQILFSNEVNNELPMTWWY